MGRENREYPGDPAVEIPPDRKKTKKRRLAVGGTLGAAAVAAWLASGEPAEKKSVAATDHHSVIKKSPVSATESTDGDTDQPDSVFYQAGPDEPSLSSSRPNSEKPDPEGWTPRELEEQLSALDTICAEFLHGDAETVLDPLHPPMMIQIEDQIKSLTENQDWKLKYPNLTNQAYLAKRCGVSRFESRARELAQALLDLPWSPIKKHSALVNLASNVFFPKLLHEAGIREIISQFGSSFVPRLGWVDEDNLRKIDDMRDYYQEMYRKAFDSTVELTYEEKRHLAQGIKKSLFYDYKFDIYSRAQKDRIKVLERDYVTLPELADSHKSFLEQLEKPPENPYSGDWWQRDIYTRLNSLIGSMKENQIDDPIEIGCDYTLAELEEMRNNLRPDEAE